MNEGEVGGCSERGGQEYVVSSLGYLGCKTNNIGTGNNGLVVPGVWHNVNVRTKPVSRGKCGVRGRAVGARTGQSDHPCSG